MYAGSPYQPKDPKKWDPKDDQDSVWSKIAQFLTIFGFIFFLIGLIHMSPFYNLEDGSRDWISIAVSWGIAIISILVAMLFQWIDNRNEENEK